MDPSASVPPLRHRPLVVLLGQDHAHEPEQGGPVGEDPPPPGTGASLPCGAAPGCWWNGASGGAPRGSGGRPGRHLRPPRGARRPGGTSPGAPPPPGGAGPGRSGGRAGRRSCGPPPMRPPGPPWARWPGGSAWPGPGTSAKPPRGGPWRWPAWSPTWAPVTTSLTPLSPRRTSWRRKEVPCGLVLAGPRVHPEHPPAAVGGHPHRHHRRDGDHPAVLPDAGGVQPEVGVLPAGGAAPEGLHLGVEVLQDPGDLAPPSIPRARTRPATLRVETPFTQGSFTTAARARSARRRGFRREGCWVPGTTLGIRSQVVPTRVSQVLVR